MLPRETWQDPEKPVAGPAPRGTPKHWVIHYPAGNAEPTGDQVPGYLRAIQASYLASRGYSIGYSWGVAQDGSRWEIRGDDFNQAANAGKKVQGNFNNISQSIFVMVKGDDPATPKAVAAINSIIATHPTWNVLCHMDVDYTACCGAGLIAQVRDGTIGQHTAPPVDPEPPEPPSQEDTMLYIAIPAYPGHTNDSEWWCMFESGAVRRAVNSDVTYAQQAGLPQIPQTSTEHDTFLRSIAM